MQPKQVLPLLCVICSDWKVNHLGDKCLFGPTKFTPHKVLRKHRKNQQTLQRICKHKYEDGKSAFILTGKEFRECMVCHQLLFAEKPIYDYSISGTVTGRISSGALNQAPYSRVCPDHNIKGFKADRVILDELADLQSPDAGEAGGGRVPGCAEGGLADG